MHRVPQPENSTAGHVDLPALLARPAVEVAPLLLGATLTHTTPVGDVTLRLTEVEAYLGEGVDPGSHAFRGPGRRNAVMFGPPATLYVYFTYGMHHCANVVCSPEGSASAVLLRAGRVVEGLGLARSRRGDGVADRDLARGPARLTRAMGIALADDGAVIGASPAELAAFTLAMPSAPVTAVATGPRTGVSGDGGSDAYPWRFWIPGDDTVSPYRAHRPRRRSPSR